AGGAGPPARPSPCRCCAYFFAAQGFLAAQGFFAAHGFFAEQGFLAAHGLADLAAQGFFPAQGFDFWAMAEAEAPKLRTPATTTAVALVRTIRVLSLTVPPLNPSASGFIPGQAPSVPWLSRAERE